jgi:GNAT superfamily N-acetyltransferase
MSARIDPYRLRLATTDDVAVVARHRVAMFRDMGILPAGDAAPLEAASARYLAPAIAAADYRGWLVEVDDAVVAGAGAVVRPLLPRPGYPDGGREAYVLNVYTEPAHRRRGLARALMDAIVDWSRGEGIARVALHASDDGRPLYASLGFRATNEMTWDVPR